MTALIRSEFLAVRTLRTTWILPVALRTGRPIVGASMGDAGKPGRSRRISCASRWRSRLAS